MSEIDENGSCTPPIFVNSNENSPVIDPQCENCVELRREMLDFRQQVDGWFSTIIERFDNQDGSLREISQSIQSMNPLNTTITGGGFPLQLQLAAAAAIFASQQQGSTQGSTQGSALGSALGSSQIGENPLSLDLAVDPSKSSSPATSQQGDASSRSNKRKNYQPAKVGLAGIVQEIAPKLAKWTPNANKSSNSNSVAQMAPQAPAASGNSTAPINQLEWKGYLIKMPDGKIKCKACKKIFRWQMTAKEHVRVAHLNQM